MNRRTPAATNRQLAVRLAVARALGRSRDLDDVYSAALNTLAEVLDVSRASVLLFDPDGVMRFKAYRGLSSEYRSAVQGHSPWTPDSVDAVPLLVPDVTRDPSLEGYLPVFAQERIAALGFIPLVSLGRVIGKFMLYYDTPHTFDDVRPWLGANEGHTLFAPKGCDACSMSGYADRTGLFEVMPVSKAIRGLISDGAPARDIRNRALEEKMSEFRQGAMLKVARGETSTEEVFRVVPSEHLTIDE